jgi:hypothetical protein
MRVIHDLVISWGKGMRIILNSIVHNLISLIWLIYLLMHELLTFETFIPPRERDEMGERHIMLGNRVKTICVMKFQKNLQ